MNNNAFRDVMRSLARRARRGYVLADTAWWRLMPIVFTCANFGVAAAVTALAGALRPMAVARLAHRWEDFLDRLRRR